MNTLEAHRCWKERCRRSWVNFQTLAQDPSAEQEKKLLKYVRDSEGTKFGTQHGFKQVRSVEEFRRQVPIRQYEDLEAWVIRMKQGHPDILTHHAVTLFEKTSGSVSPAKYIPYTKTLLAEFQEAVRCWMFDLYEQYPEVTLGPWYWSLTPLARTAEKTPGGVPVGMMHDAEYLAEEEQAWLGEILCVPGQLADCPDLATCRYGTLFSLLACPELRFISVWHPTFLTELWRVLLQQGEALFRDLGSGSCSAPGLEWLESTPDPVRAAILRNRWKEGALCPADVWPKLALISCWGDGVAAYAREELARLFAGVPIQPKGLLATEAVTSIPLGAGSGGVLALSSHFYEFEAENSHGEIVDLPDLRTGRSYQVIVTTGGGFWRYRTGDRVKVVGWSGKLPRLEFLGRAEGLSDCCGEKLHPDFVAEQLMRLKAEGHWSGEFALLAPAFSRRQYVFFLEGEASEALPEILDQALRSNPHYQYARQLEQLGPIRLFRIQEKGFEGYLRRMERSGQRVGAVKPTFLSAQAGWENDFAGSFVETHCTLKS